MNQQILKELKRVEKEFNVKIILACESGSRAWGFPSIDSDYDVRFIYVNKRDWYLSIGEKRDVIELPIDNALDINGWDLKKTLQLLKKSNPPLMEWLCSPIRYYTWDEALEKLLDLSQVAFMPETACHHYLSMAVKSMEKVSEHKKARLKTYMYAIRPVLCCEWIVKKSKLPPLNINELMDELIENDPFRDKVLTLIEMKKTHPEKFSIERSEFIERFLKNKIFELKSVIPKNSQKMNMEMFDDVFRSIISKSIISS